jgi:hypothetical protein
VWLLACLNTSCHLYHAKDSMHAFVHAPFWIHSDYCTSCPSCPSSSLPHPPPSRCIEESSKSSKRGADIIAAALSVAPRCVSCMYHMYLSWVRWGFSSSSLSCPSCPSSDSPPPRPPEARTTPSPSRSAPYPVKGE